MRSWLAVSSGLSCGKPILEKHLSCLDLTFRRYYGPEFVATAILRWLGDAGIDTALIDPGKPWQNATDESFNGKFRDEFLSLQWFRNRMDAKVGIEQWRQHYNEVRPHSSLGYLTPAEFKAQLGTRSDDGGRSPAMPARADQEEHGDARSTFTGAVLQ